MFGISIIFILLNLHTWGSNFCMSLFVFVIALLLLYSECLDYLNSKLHQPIYDIDIYSSNIAYIIYNQSSLLPRTTLKTSLYNNIYDPLEILPTYTFAYTHSCNIQKIWAHPTNNINYNIYAILDENEELYLMEGNLSVIKRISGNGVAVRDAAIASGMLEVYYVSKEVAYVYDIASGATKTHPINNAAYQYVQITEIQTKIFAYLQSPTLKTSMIEQYTYSNKLQSKKSLQIQYEPQLDYTYIYNGQSIIYPRQYSGLITNKLQKEYIGHYQNNKICVYDKNLKLVWEREIGVDLDSVVVCGSNMIYIGDAGGEVRVGGISFGDGSDVFQEGFVGGSVVGSVEEGFSHEVYCEGDRVVIATSVSDQFKIYNNPVVVVNTGNVNGNGNGNGGGNGNGNGNGNGGGNGNGNNNNSNNNSNKNKNKTKTIPNTPKQKFKATLLSIIQDNSTQGMLNNTGNAASIATTNIGRTAMRNVMYTIDLFWFYSFHQPQYPQFVKLFSKQTDLMGQLRLKPQFLSQIQIRIPQIQQQNTQYRKVMNLHEKFPTNVFFFLATQNWYTFNLIISLLIFIVFLLVKISLQPCQHSQNKIYRAIYAYVNLNVQWWMFLLGIIEGNIAFLTFYAGIQLQIPVSFNFVGKINLVAMDLLMLIVLLFCCCFYFLVYKYSDESLKDQLRDISKGSMKGFLLMSMLNAINSLFRGWIHGFFLSNNHLQLLLLISQDIMMIIFILTMYLNFRNKILFVTHLLYFSSIFLFDSLLFSYIYYQIPELDYQLTSMIITITMLSFIFLKVVLVVISDIVDFCGEWTAKNQIENQFEGMVEGQEVGRSCGFRKKCRLGRRRENQYFVYGDIMKTYHDNFDGVSEVKEDNDNDDYEYRNRSEYRNRNRNDDDDNDSNCSYITKTQKTNLNPNPNNPTTHSQPQTKSKPQKHHPPKKIKFPEQPPQKYFTIKDINQSQKDPNQRQNIILSSGTKKSIAAKFLKAMLTNKNI